MNWNIATKRLADRVMRGEAYVQGCKWQTSVTRVRALFSIFIFLTTLSFASPDGRQMERFDSTKVQPRQPSSSTKDSYIKDDFYQYDTKDQPVVEEPNVFDRIWNSFWEHLWDGVKGVDPKKGTNPWAIFWLLVLVALVVIVVLKVTNTGVSTIFSGKRKAVEKTDATMEDVDIHALDYDRMISEAISRKDFRLGVRLWFLRTLKSLSDKELLAWKLDKTNSDYYYELSGTTHQKDFGDVSYVYDYIWYGEFPVDENSYKTAESKFKSFYERIG